MTTQGQDEKRYDPNDTTLKFVNRPDDLDPLSNDDLRAEMSCGHAVTAESLTGWCRSLLHQGQFIFKCPASKDGTKCDAEWSYEEVRRLAMLTLEEMQHFEEKMAQLAAAQYCDLQKCPGCKNFVERKNPANLSVRCTVCTANNGKDYEFCWQCLQPWKGVRTRSDCCDNAGCANLNPNLQLLEECETIDLPQVKGVSACPSIRACPTCGYMVGHNNTGCKNIRCPRCQKEFCFVCLKLTPECLKTSSYFLPCSVAPKQTSIPVWRKN